MKPQATHQFAALIGIDWADAKHDICLQVAGSKAREFAVLIHRAESIDAWARALKQRFGGQPKTKILSSSVTSSNAGQPSKLSNMLVKRPLRPSSARTTYAMRKSSNSASRPLRRPPR